MAPPKPTTQIVTRLQSQIPVVEEVTEGNPPGDERLTSLEQNMATVLSRLSILDRLEQMMNKGEISFPSAEKEPEDEGTPGKTDRKGEEEKESGKSNTTRKPDPITGSGGGSGFSFGSSQNRSGSLIRKFELPLFEGDNVDGWAFKMEQYFELRELTDGEKLRAASMGLDGEALEWYRWERERNPFRNWEQLKKRAFKYFTPEGGTTPTERLLVLRQEGTVREYCREFRALASQAVHIPEDVLENIFMIGLIPAVRFGVKMFEPHSLDRMMALAESVDEWASHGGGLENYSSGSRPSSRPRTEKREAILGPKPTWPKPTVPLSPLSRNLATNGGQSNKSLNSKTQTPTTEAKRISYRRLTEAEKKERQALGLCYKCDDKWFPGHKCKYRELQVFIVRSDGTEYRELEQEEDDSDGLQEEITELATISLQSLVGISSPKTVKLRGTLYGKEVVVLIDSGATHNFIDDSVVKQLGLQLEETTGYGVLLATGLAVKGNGVCRGLELQLPSIMVEDDFLPIELGNADIILGSSYAITCSCR